MHVLRRHLVASTCKHAAQCTDSATLVETELPWRPLSSKRPCPSSMESTQHLRPTVAHPTTRNTWPLARYSLSEHYSTPSATLIILSLWVEGKLANRYRARLFDASFLHRPIITIPLSTPVITTLFPSHEYLNTWWGLLFVPFEKASQFILQTSIRSHMLSWMASCPW